MGIKEFITGVWFCGTESDSERAEISEHTIQAAKILLPQLIIAVLLSNSVRFSPTGVILGWGCLVLGLLFRRKIIAQRSIVIGNLYAVSGVVLLFVGGAGFGGWILALGHQIYGCHYADGWKVLLERLVFWFCVFLLVGNMLKLLLG